MLKIKEIFQKINGIRNYKAVRVVATVFFPVFLVLIAEVTQMQNRHALFNFITQRTTVLIFNIFFIGLIYAGLLYLVKRAWVAAIPLTVICCIFALIEHFKFKSSGIHFDVADLVMAKDVGELTKFGGVALNKWIVATILVLVLYVLLLFWLRAKVTLKKRLYSALVGSACVVLAASIIATPVGAPFFWAARINTGVASNPIVSEIKFNENSFLAGLIEGVNAKATGKVEKYTPPEDIEKSVDSVLLNGTEATSDTQPNIVVIMCESYADFRTLFKDVEDKHYTNFDIFRNDGKAFTTIVPAFGGSTVRTEFEMLFGLPMYSISTVVMPQFELKPRERQVTIASQLKSKGYYNTYVHPYIKDFYGRSSIYTHFGFDKMLFDEELQHRKRPGYTADQEIFEVIMEEINGTDAPLYLHATTMQNHLPYAVTGGPSEYDYFMDRIDETDGALKYLKEQLEASKEPTIVVFTGDHLPNFVESEAESIKRAGRTFYNPFSDLGLTQATAHKIYRQEAFAWSNYGADLSAFSGDISTFYLPYMMIDVAGVGLSPLGNTVLSEKKNMPVYNSNYKTKIDRNETLDILTHDIVYGECLSDR